MSEPSDVTHVTNETDAPELIANAAPEQPEFEVLADIIGRIMEQNEDNTRRIAESTELFAKSADRIANAMEAYCKLHGAKICG